MLAAGHVVGGSANLVQQNNFQKKGFIRVNYPEYLRFAVQKAMESWEAFCQLPKAEKAAFAFLEDPHGDGAGYELKEGTGASRDLKENFHVTLFQQERLRKIAGDRKIPFLDDALELLNKMEPIILQFAKEMEEKYGLQGFVEETKASKPCWTLRYLNYFGDQQPGAELAAPHADKGAFTMHLYESDGGCQYYSLKSRRWKELPVGSEETVIFNGMQMQEISKGAHKALYHRVEATEQTAKNGRKSMVCFVSIEGRPQYDKSAYGSMQRHPVAFNYDIEHNVFETFFKKRDVP